MAASMKHRLMKFGRIIRHITAAKQPITATRQPFNTTFCASNIFYSNILKCFPKVMKPMVSGGHPSKTKVVSLIGLAGAARSISFFSKKEENNVLLNVQKAKNAMYSGNIEQAEVLYHEALKAAEDRWKNSKMTEIEYVEAKTYIMDGLADTAMSKGDFENAEKLYKETMKGCLQSGLDKTDNAMVELSIKLATVYAIRDEGFKAVQGYEFAIETQEAKLQNDPHSDPDTKGLLGLALESYGRYKLLHSEIDIAIDLLKRSYEIAQSVMGVSNPQTLILMNDIATAYIMKKEYSLAEKLIRETILIAEEANLPELSTFYCNLGSLFIRMSKFEEAQAQCEISLKKAKRNKDIFGAQQALGCLQKIKQAKA